MHSASGDVRSIPSKWPRLRRLGTRELARAHLTLSERPEVSRSARQALQDVGAALGRELGCLFEVTARLLEAVVMPATGLAHTAAFALVELAGTGGVAVLELEPAVLFAALEQLAGAGSKPGPVTRLTRLEEAAFAFLCLAALGAFRAQEPLQRRFVPCLTGVTLRREEVLRRLDARQRHLGVELWLAVGPVSGRGRLVLPAMVLEGALKEWPVERAPQVAPEVLAASLSVRCSVGRTLLSSTALESLGVGDVVLFEDVHREDGRLLGPGRLIAPGFELAGGFTSRGFSLTRARRRAPSQELTMTAVQERSESMTSLPVDVEIELTRLRVPLSELAALQPGALLPLHINASEPVLLRVGDRVVARAELVDIEGAVGARILSLLP